MSGGLEPRPHDLRASYEDRDRIIERLRAAFEDGRLAPEELDERVESALIARTHGDLDALVRDLPAAPSSPATAPARPAKDLVRLRADKGNIERTGTWTLPRRLEAEADKGNVFLDLTEAVITEPFMELALSVDFGTVRLVVPPEVHVEVGDVSTHHGSVKRRRSARRRRGVPVRMRLEISGRVRFGNIVIRGPRRGFWNWLLGRDEDRDPRSLPA